MLNINDDTILVNATELRANMPKINKQIKLKKVIVMKRGKPFAVLSDYDEFQEKENRLELLEDMILGHLAKQRDEKSKPLDYIPSEEFEKSLDL